MGFNHSNCDITYISNFWQMFFIHTQEGCRITLVTISNNNDILLLSFVDEVTRDYIPSVRSPPLARACCLLPWHPYSLLLDDPLWSGVEEFVSPSVTVCVCHFNYHACITNNG